MLSLVMAVGVIRIAPKMGDLSEILHIQYGAPILVIQRWQDDGCPLVLEGVDDAVQVVASASYELLKTQEDRHVEESWLAILLLKLGRLDVPVSYVG